MFGFIHDILTARADSKADPATRHLAYDTLSPALNFRNTGKTMVLGAPDKALLPTTTMQPDDTGMLYMMQGDEKYSGATVRRTCGSHLVNDTLSTPFSLLPTRSRSSYRASIPVDIGLEVQVARRWNKMAEKPYDMLLLGAFMQGTADPSGYTRPRRYPLVQLQATAGHEGAVVERMVVGNRRVPVTPQSIATTVQFFDALRSADEEANPLKVAVRTYGDNPHALRGLQAVEFSQQFDTHMYVRERDLERQKELARQKSPKP